MAQRADKERADTEQTPPPAAGVTRRRGRKPGDSRWQALPIAPLGREYVSSVQAREILGIHNNYKMVELLGTVLKGHAFRSPLDGRITLIEKAVVDELARMPREHATKRPAGAGAGLREAHANRARRRDGTGDPAEDPGGKRAMPAPPTDG